MLSPSIETLRLTLHVLAASVWVGGQIVLGGLVPTLRRTAPDAVKSVARAFARVSWPAFAVLVVTGIWNIMSISMTEQSSDYQATVMAHVGLAVVTGVAVAAHSISRSKLVIALGGAIGLFASLAALYVGVLISSIG